MGLPYGRSSISISAEVEINKASAGGRKRGTGNHHHRCERAGAPAGRFQQIRLLTANGFEGQQIELNRPFPRSTGNCPNCRWGYAVRATRFTRWPDMDMVLHYAKGSVSGPDGIKLADRSDPEIYIYGVMKRAFMAKLDAAKADVADQVFRQRIEAKGQCRLHGAVWQKHHDCCG